MQAQGRGATPPRGVPVVPEVVAPGCAPARERAPVPIGGSGEAADPGGELDAHLLLVAERQRAYARLVELEGEVLGVVSASEGANVDDEHDPEGSTIAYERARAGSLRSDAAAYLAEVDAALDRLAQGRYGVCERCGCPIGPERLSALPTARLCAGCAGVPGPPPVGRLGTGAVATLEAAQRPGPPGVHGL